MKLDINGLGLYFKVGEFIGLVHFQCTAKMKSTTLAEFVKSCELFLTRV